MEYREIVAVTGLGGLFHLLATKSDGAIVRNLADNTTKFISARLHNVTPLESIEIYTTGENVRLHQVLQAIQSSNVPRPSAKAADKEIRTYIKTVFPDIDEDRVYTSDMKKMLKWYDLLDHNKLLDFSSYNKQAEEATEETAAHAEDEKPAKKAHAQKEETPADEAPVAEEAAPAKKAAKKKAADTDAAEGEAPKKKAAPKKKKEGE